MKAERVEEAGVGGWWRGRVSIKAQLRDTCNNLVEWKKKWEGGEQKGDLGCFALYLE